MKNIPDLREQLHPHADYVKTMLARVVKQGRRAIPIHALMACRNLDPGCQRCNGTGNYFAVIEPWFNADERRTSLAAFAQEANAHADGFFLYGSGRGICKEFGDGEVFYLFASCYLPGRKPWIWGQVYTVVEQEIIYDTEICSSDKNILWFDIPGLWPEPGGENGRDRDRHGSEAGQL